jgi:biopolymer transport protein ExbB
MRGRRYAVATVLMLTVLAVADRAGAQAPAGEATPPAAGSAPAPQPLPAAPVAAPIAAPAVPQAAPAAAEPVAAPSGDAGGVATPGAASAAPPVAAAPAGAAAAPTIASAALPRDLSPWGMFINADIVVKVIMVGLLLASLVTWTVWLAKSIELMAAKRQARRRIRVLQEARSLGEVDQHIGDGDDAVARLVRTAITEVQLSAHSSAEGLKERVAWLLERLEIGAGRRIGRGMGILASIGATAPFVGLFGTVWGIMNSFIGISNAHTTNLAVVAPGIAEALLATALGLFAAIPAVVIYNVFARQIGGYRAVLADAGALVMRLVSRDCERAPMPLSRAAE